MSAIATAAAGHLGGKDVSLQSLLYTMKINDRLTSFRHALDDLMIQQAAEREGISPTDAELQAEADALRAAMGLHKADATHAWLEERGMSVDDFDQYLVRIVSARKLKEKLTADKVEAYFMEHRPAFDAARIARLALASEAEAKEVAGQLASGKATFASLSGKFPADAAGSPADGAGFTLRMHMDPALATAVFRASPGQVVGPVATSVGTYEIARVEEIRRSELDPRTVGLVSDLVFGQWLQGERKRAGLEFRLPGLIASA